MQWRGAKGSRITNINKRATEGIYGDSSGVWNMDAVFKYAASTGWNVGPKATSGGAFLWGGGNNIGSGGGYASTLADAGLCGDGKSIGNSNVTQLGAVTTWNNISGSAQHSLATRTDGTLWAWGRNINGCTTLGGSTYSYAAARTATPTQIGILTTWASVEAQSDSGVSFAIKTDGTLWAWGAGSSGVLGLGNTTSYSSPKQVGALTNWKSISNRTGLSVSAIKTDGTLWTWGNNASGQLGLGNTTWYSSPKQVGSLGEWKSSVSALSTTFAIKTDGTLWAWGLGTYGNLGLGNSTAYSSPKQVGLDTWTTITSSAYVTLGIKADGTLWGWGQNNLGQLGLGDNIVRSIPTQIGNLKTWSSVKTSKNSTIAIRTDGTLWTWGFNGQGQLGLNNTTTYSSPKQVGALTTWGKAGFFDRRAMAIK